MLFNTFEYIIGFLPLALLCYFVLARFRLGLAARAWLVLCSLFFYASWRLEYLPLLVGSIGFNYLAGRGIGRIRESRVAAWLLAGSIAGNLSLLGYYKYSGFFVENINALLGLHWAVPRQILPLAISFFTFQQIAYLVACRRGETRVEGVGHYALFVSFFPQLVAGPIVQYQEMMPQFRSLRNLILDYRHVAQGLFLFSLGLLKKVILADTFAPWVAQGFDHSSFLTLFEAWAASLSYTLQLYFDFSGYTDMALGVGLMFNIRLPANFNSPYRALSVQDFWSRWHMTLSRFLLHYVYIPLGGSRVGQVRGVVNVMITFLACGIWHGAGWTFVVWGVAHGLAICVHRLWRATGLHMGRPLAWLLTFLFVNLAWVPFRALDWGAAIRVLRGMAGLDGVVLPAFLQPVAGGLSHFGVTFGGFVEHVGGGYMLPATVLAGLVVVLWPMNSTQLAGRFLTNAAHMAATLLFMALSFYCMATGRVTEFLYFNF